MYKNKNVLVTGGAGLIGQSLVRKLLAKGAHVRATQYKTRAITLKHKNLEVITCDLNHADDAVAAFKDMDIVFLGAAKVGGAKANQDSASDLIMYNLSLSSRLISLASKMKLETCAFISSSFVYPPSSHPHSEHEGFFGNPPSYGLGWIKRYLETLCKHFHSTSIKTQYAIIRPTAYYGIHDNFKIDECHVIPALIMKAIAHMDPFEVWGNGDEVRSFTYVDDVVDGLLLTTAKHAVADPINICTVETHTIKELVTTILDVAGYSPKIVYRLDMPTSLATVISSPAKAKAVLGWEAKTTLKEGIAKTWLGLNSLQKVSP